MNFLFGIVLGILIGFVPVWLELMKLNDKCELKNPGYICKLVPTPVAKEIR